MKNCIFCQIVNNEIESYKIWEDDEYLAFLSIFPNTLGATVVITKEHYPSYAFDLPDGILNGLVLASKNVAKLLDSKLEGVGRTSLVLEGFGIDHVHAKLFPLHGTKFDKWQPIKSKVNIYFTKYEGYVSSHDYELADTNELNTLAKKIRNT